MGIEWTIIDGNNLIHADPDLLGVRQQDFQSARQVLVRRLEAVCGATAGRVTVVFDSRTPKAFTGFEGSPLDVRFAEPGVGADAYIERLVHGAAKPDRILVVTSDAIERRVVEAAGALTQSCRRFLEQARTERGQLARRLEAVPGRGGSGGPFRPRMGDCWKETRPG